LPALPDLLYVALFAVALPLWDYFVYWPKVRRQPQAEATRARMRLWRGAIISAWAVVAVGVAIWIANDRSWASLGFTIPGGWKLYASIALVLLVAAYFAAAVMTVARSTEARAGLRSQLGALTDLLPHTRSEMVWFGAVSLTAGFCEEFLFRGYLIWALTPWFGWWGAATVSLVIFALGHLAVYQGWHGVVRTGISGAIYTLVVAIFGSLWPAIAMHAILDVGNGAFAWLTIREGEPSPNGAEGTPSPAG
jgi:membrane protease YdiL (CAAX protease family)